MNKIYVLLIASTMLGVPVQGQINLPYNPDGDANGWIGVSDLQDVLSIYDGPFAPGTILVDSLELSVLLDSLQAQITALQNDSGDAFRCGDDVLHEGYWYNTTSIGDRCWFSENLRFLPEVSPSSTGSDDHPHAYVYGYEGSDVLQAQNTLNYHQYGVLYNFPAVQMWGLCPSGWHVPTDEEWTVMTSSLGSDSFAGNSLKTTYGWNNGGNGTNLSGFSGLPGGYRSYDMYFSGAGSYAYWWSSLPNDSVVWNRLLDYAHENVFRGLSSQHYGFSVRCVRDAE